MGFIVLCMLYNLELTTKGHAHQLLYCP